MDEDKQMSLAQEIDLIVEQCANVAKLAKTSAEILEMKAKAEALLPRIAEQAEALQRALLENAQTREELALARQAADDAHLDRMRVERVIINLDEALAKRFNEEDEAARQAAYEAADADAERVAQRFRAEWDEAVGCVVDLLCDQMRSGDMVDAVNRDLPDGKPPLNRAEGRVANFHDHGSYDTGISEIRFRTPKTLIGDLAGNVVWPPDRDFELDVMRRGKAYSMQDVWWLWRHKREDRLKNRRKSLD